MRRTSSILAVEQLPRRIHTTFGGCPRTKLRWWKCASSETMTNPCAAAWVQTVSSSAACRPRVRGRPELGASAAPAGRLWSDRDSQGDLPAESRRDRHRALPRASTPCHLDEPVLLQNLEVLLDVLQIAPHDLRQRIHGARPAASDRAEEREPGGCEEVAGGLCYPVGTITASSCASRRPSGPWWLNRSRAR